MIVEDEIMVHIIVINMRTIVNLLSKYAKLVYSDVLSFKI